jgi:multidrug resistance efflux pump
VTVARLIDLLANHEGLGGYSAPADAEVAALREQLRSFIESRENARSALLASESLLQLARQESENTVRVAAERLQLVTSGVLPRLAQREIDRELATARREVAAAEAEVRQHRSSFIQADIQIQSFVAQTRAIYEKEARELSARRADEIDAASVAAQYTTGGAVKATVGGYAEASQPFFVGQSVELGEPLYNITPSMSEYVVEAAVANRDVDKIEVGDRVQIRPRGFASARFNPVEGRVEHIAHQAEVLPSSAAMLATSERREPEYKVRISIVEAPLHISLGLRNGMIADVTFVTGQRTAALYLLAPILSRIDKPFSEAR